MKEIKQYYDALSKKGITRTSDLPYGKKQVPWTVTFILPVIDTTEGFYKMIIPDMALNKYNFSVRCDTQCERMFKAIFLRVKDKPLDDWQQKACCFPRPGFC